MRNQDNGFDSTIAWKLAGMIVAALLVVFILQRLNFRFVTAVGPPA